MSITTVDQLSGTACESTFRVYMDGHDPVVLRLWIVTGGTPALAFDDYSYTRRYDKVERYSNERWLGNRYAHQTRDGWGIIPMDQTPSFDDLPNGLQDVEQFLEHALPLRAKRDQRMALLPSVRTIKSRRVHDRDNRTYVWAKIDMRSYGVSPVTFTSGICSGRCDDMITLFGTVWRDVQAVCNPLFDSDKGAWEQLSSEDFQAVHDALWALYVSDASTAKGLW